MSGLSKNNARIRELRKIIKNHKERSKSGKFAIEGLELLRESIATGHSPIDVFLSESSDLGGTVEALIQETEAKLWRVGDGLIASIASTVTPQPVIATLQNLDSPIADVMSRKPTFLLVGIEINEPGNAGSIIRSAASSGAHGVIFSNNSVDIYNPKTVRSSAGAIFRVPVVRGGETSEIIKQLKEQNLNLVGLSGKGTETYTDIDFLNPFAVFLGNESRGLDSIVMKDMDQLAVIPMDAGVESLNVSTAASVASFEAKRQRSATR
ncbi:MAG TPA: RNA methyltransferase [Acidimicrobiales bacterium]|nr:RNA methyltransferase [Acidimicrobiales bacterium]HJM98157.1 RNA methyltransferase [Acidimicrobiales bacterium]